MKNPIAIGHHVVATQGHDIELLNGKAQILKCFLDETLSEGEAIEPLTPHHVEGFIEDAHHHQNCPRLQ